MAEGKYGRLFTEGDVRAIVQRSGGMTMTLDQVLTEVPLTFPPDEPLFLLRGQDKAAPEALDGDGYYEALYAVDADPKFRLKVAGAALEIREWQATHPDRVKAPD